MDFEELKGTEQTAYLEQPEIYHKETKAIPAPQREIGTDIKNQFLYNIINAGVAGTLDISMLESFTRVSQSRDNTFSLLDSMCEDAITAAVLETYAEDATEYNDQGQIVWCEASNSNIAKYVTFLLDAMSVDKHIYKWAHSLCKYGDVYLRLFHESDMQEQDEVLSELNPKIAKKGRKKKSLNEDLKIKVYSKNDHYVNYMEMMPNPAEMFELVRHGKTYAYVKADVNSSQNKSDMLSMSGLGAYSYKFKKTDVNVYQATNYVHGCLEDNSSRTPETVEIFTGDKDEDGNEISNIYTVKRGQSLLYNNFKSWRELQLLENSVLLNRLTKSSITRIINVEVGDMPKEMIGPHLQGIKSLIEQKSAIKTGGGISEYTNPGPIENNVYVPTHEGVGTLTADTIGGDVDVKSLADLSYYQDKYFGGLRVPKQYFGVTDDNAGFSGGESLSIISSRYAKMVKRVQNTLIQMLTDAINILLIDRGLISYVNEFTLRMQAPTTSEEKDRRENASTKVNLVTDVMATLSDIEDPVSKLKILKALLSTAITNVEVIDIIQKEIDKLELKDSEEKTEEKVQEDLDDLTFDDEIGGEEDMSSSEEDMFGSSESGDDEYAASDEFEDSLSDVEDSNTNDNNIDDNGQDDYLPSPDDIGVDLTQNI